MFSTSILQGDANSNERTFSYCQSKQCCNEHSCLTAYYKIGFKPCINCLGQLCLFSLLHTLISRRDLRDALRDSTIALPTTSLPALHSASLSAPNRDREDSDSFFSTEGRFEHAFSRSTHHDEHCSKTTLRRRSPSPLPKTTSEKPCDIHQGHPITGANDSHDFRYETADITSISSSASSGTRRQQVWSHGPYSALIGTPKLILATVSSGNEGLKPAFHRFA